MEELNEYWRNRDRRQITAFVIGWVEDVLEKRQEFDYALECIEFWLMHHNKGL